MWVHRRLTGTFKCVLVLIINSISWFVSCQDFVASDMIVSSMPGFDNCLWIYFQVSGKMIRLIQL